MYDKWVSIVKKYDSKRSERNSLNTFHEIFNSRDFENYILWIKSFVKDEKIGIDYKILVIYCTLTGLRASEAIESINLIKGDYGRLKYLDSENNILKHYGFSKIFSEKQEKPISALLMIMS